MIIKNKKIIIENGNIISLEDIKNDIIIVKNNKSEIYKDCVITPNFTDSHCHIWGLGMKHSGGDLSNARSIEECIKIIEEDKFFRGNWLIGRGWNQEFWGNEMPRKEHLDKYFPNIPVCLTRIDGHAIWVNSKAIEISKISQDFKVEGGEILIDEKGEIIGIFIDNAIQLIERNIPNFTYEQLKSFILKGIDAANKSGITFFHDMDVNSNLHNIYIELDEQKILNSKVYSFLTAQNREYLSFDNKHYKGKNYKVQGIKLYCDGALGSRGAALSENYKDYNSKGLILLEYDDMLNICIEAAQFGYDIAIHCIGDKAVELVLKVYIKLRELGYNNILRIEHSQLAKTDDIVKYSQYDIVASIQPIHFTSDYEMAIKRLGLERLQNIGYPWKSFLKNNVTMIAGSDFPIESEKVLLGINSFVTREPDVNNMKEKISLDEALQCYTTNPNKLVNYNYKYLEINELASFNIIRNFNINNLKNSTVEKVFFEGLEIL